MFPFLIGVIALLLAAIAAFFSITGMANIFPGWSTLVMTSAIEAGKLISVSVLYRMWKELKWLKWLLIPMTAVIMLITSIGVYGHLSSGYEKTASHMRTHESQMQLGVQMRTGVKEKVESYEKAIERKQDRASSLVELRSKQENRLDSLYARNQLRSAKEVQASIAQADKEIAKLNAESDSLNAIIDQAMVEVTSLDSAMIVKESNASTGEVGTVKFMARILGWTTDSTVNLFILLLISVFDPLSILLLVVFNMAMDKANKKEDEQEELIHPPDDLIYTPDQPEQNDEPDDTTHTLEQHHEPMITDVPNKPIEAMDDRTSEVVVQKKKVTDEELYISLLYVLYHNGKLTENDHLDLYEKFVEKVRSSNIVCTEAQIDAFLQKCVDLKVIKIGKRDRIALKSYTDALKMVSEGLEK